MNRTRVVLFGGMLLPLVSLANGCLEQPATPGKTRTPVAAESPNKQNKTNNLKRIIASLPRHDSPPLTAAGAALLVRLSLECTRREYPNKPGQVLAGDDEVLPPRTLHPAFYGCFDWHSAVHGHWAMVRVLRRFPRVEQSQAMRAVLSSHLTPQRMEGELRYFEASHHRLYERPYGWAWYLRLAAELHAWENPAAKPWREALKPLETLLSRRTIRYLAALSLPVRAGTHHNTAFALCHIHDYAAAVGNKDLLRAIAHAAHRFYRADRACPTHYEPSGEDFISPCLAEADLMRRVLDKSQFSLWFQEFMPTWTSVHARSIMNPPRVLDAKDPKIGHLIGLDFQRAWAMEGVASVLGQTDETELLGRLAAAHRKHGLDLIGKSGYGGSHWLATFAIYLLTEAGQSI